MRSSMFAAAFAAILAAAGLPAAAQGSSAGTDAAGTDAADFEAALFAGSGAADSGDGAAGLPAAPQTAAGTAGAVGSDAARTKYLVGGTVVAKAQTAVSGDRDSEASDAGVSGRLFAKVAIPDYGSLFVAYNASHAFFQGYSGEGAAPAADDPYEPDYSLAELHYSFDIGKKVFVRIGNQLIAWGPSKIWTPVDFINLEKADAFADLDTRVGKPGLRVHVPLSRGNLFGFADFSSTSEDGTYGDPVKTVNLAGRGDFTAGGFEFGFTAYGGREARPRYGADASGRLLGTTVYGEYAATTGKDGSAPSVQTAAGFSRVMDELKRWTLSAEGFFNSRGRDLGGYSAAELALLPEDERIPLYQGKWYFHAALQADKLFSPDLSTTVSVTSDLSDGSYTAKLAESFSFPRSVPFVLSISYSGGGAEKEFTRYSGDGALSAALTVRMEF